MGKWAGEQQIYVFWTAVKQDMKCCLLLKLLAAGSAVIGLSSAELFPLSDVSYPHLFITDPSSMPVIWHKKSVAFMLAHSAGVRISARSVCSSTD